MSVESGVIGAWLVEDGQQVNTGDPLYLFETDKVDNEIPSPVSGVIRIMATAGQRYDVGTVIAEIT